MRTHRRLAVAALLGALAVPAAAQQPAADPVASMKSGKELFEKDCRLCHGLDRALAARHDAESWSQIVKRMVTYGAPLNAAQRPLVSRYLAARSSFAAKCSSCHEATRVVGDQPVVRDWKALAQRMAGHVTELQKQGKAPSGGGLAPAELAEIAALLQAVLPSD
jgi:mono/diheme cytochrome c family protein